MTNGTEIFRLEDIYFTPNNQKILEAINFSIYQEEQVMLFGPSGSGKSTLLKLLGLLMNPSQGQIIYKGKNIKDLDVTNYRKEVSYFFQNAHLFDKTVADNIAFPYKIRKEKFDEKKAKEDLERLQIPSSYLNKSIQDLSGGEKQRVAFIRNLQFLPKVLLLDEVTSSLDQENSELLLSYIEELKEKHGLTIIRVTHKQNELSQADRVIEIDQGEVVSINETSTRN